MRISRLLNVFFAFRSAAARMARALAAVSLAAGLWAGAPQEAEGHALYQDKFGPRDLTYNFGESNASVEAKVVLIDAHCGFGLFPRLTSTAPPGFGYDSSFVNYRYRLLTPGTIHFVPPEAGMYPQTVTFTCSGADHTPPIPDEVITNAFTVTVTLHPDAPSAPRAADAPDVPLTAAAGSLTVKWKTPSNLGDPSSLSAYHVRHRVKAGPGAWLPNSGGAEVMLANNNQAAPGSYTISGLAAVEYEVEVRATNGNVGPWYSAGSETPLFLQATVAFADTELRVGEGVSTPKIDDPGLRVLGVRVTLQLSRPAQAALTAVITPTNVTASDADYTRAPITVNFAAGASSASGNLLITNDAFPEPDETLGRDRDHHR